MITVESVGPDPDRPGEMRAEIVHLIIDLETLRIPESYPALSEHIKSSWTTVGRWSDSVVDGDDIKARLTWYLPTPEELSAGILHVAAEAYALARRDHPWEASVGVEGRREVLEPGSTFTANGRTYEIPDDGIATHFLSDAMMTETSVVFRGAHSDTGRIAASAPGGPVTPSELSPMTDLKSHLAKYAATDCEATNARRAARLAHLCAEGATDDEIEAEMVEDSTAELKAQNEALTKEVEELKAKVAEQQERLDAVGAEGVDDDDEGVEAAAAAAAPVSAKPAVTTHKAGGGAKPANWIEARRVVAAESPHMSGHDVSIEAKRRWPDLFNFQPKDQPEG